MLAAFALGGVLWNAYGLQQPAVTWAALVTFGLSLFGLGAAASSTAAYGAASHPTAVIVGRATTLRSIPTEGDTAQKTSPLAAGSLATTDKAFLDGRWLRLVFDNGQTGWVRKDDVVPVWRN